MSSNGSDRPTTVAQAAAILAGTRGGVVFRGGGTKQLWAGRVDARARLLDTTGLDGLSFHNPADLTAAAAAGTPLTALQERLAAAGQWLALDPPSAAGGATIGGLLATGDSGPRRLRYGALRDLVIGVTLVLADGTVARSGGRVIKNVAGYDLTKLCYGSLGTLGLIAEVVFRVHPLPQASATVVVPASARAATTRTIQLLASPLEPSAVDWVGDGRDGRLAVRFEGSAAGVAAQTAALRELLSAPQVQELTRTDEAALWAEFGGARLAGPRRTTAFAGTLPDRLPLVADALVRAGDDAGVAVELASHTALGLHLARFAGPADGQAHAFTGWWHAVQALGGTVLLRDRPPEVDAHADTLGPPPSSVPLLRALRARLDPDSRCAPGRLGTWLEQEADR